MSRQQTKRISRDPNNSSHTIQRPTVASDWIKPDGKPMFQVTPTEVIDYLKHVQLTTWRRLDYISECACKIATQTTRSTTRTAAKPATEDEIYQALLTSNRIAHNYPETRGIRGKIAKLLFLCQQEWIERYSKAKRSKTNTQPEYTNLEEYCNQRKQQMWHYLNVYLSNGTDEAPNILALRKATGGYAWNSRNQEHVYLRLEQYYIDLINYNLQKSLKPRAIERRFKTEKQQGLTNLLTQQRFSYAQAYNKQKHGFSKPSRSRSMSSLHSQSYSCYVPAYKKQRCGLSLRKQNYLDDVLAGNLVSKDFDTSALSLQYIKHTNIDQIEQENYDLAKALENTTLSSSYRSNSSQTWSRHNSGSIHSNSSGFNIRQDLSKHSVLSSFDNNGQPQRLQIVTQPTQDDKSNDSVSSVQIVNSRHEKKTNNKSESNRKRSAVSDINRPTTEWISEPIPISQNINSHHDIALTKISSSSTRLQDGIKPNSINLSHSASINKIGNNTFSKPQITSRNHSLSRCHSFEEKKE